MRYLLDTQIILWALLDDKSLDKKVKELILNKNNEIYYSTVSSWEVEIKHQKDKSFKLTGEQFIFLCDQNYLLNLNINNKHVNNLKNVENKINKDPFDRMLLAQAKAENMILMGKYNLVLEILNSIETENEIVKKMKEQCLENTKEG